MKKVKRKNPQNPPQKALKKSLVLRKTVIFASWQNRCGSEVNSIYSNFAHHCLFFGVFVQIALKLLRAFFTAKQGKYKLPHPATYESLELVKKHNIFVKYTQKPSQNFYTKNKKYFFRRQPISKYTATSSEKSDLGIANYLYFTNKHIFYILPRAPAKKGINKAGSRKKRKMPPWQIEHLF